ncbi:DUF1919 domain-containing protein [Bacillus sp. EB01]|uniref:DUF1919 domain-containing protein n=1 Tax=Bacillus sp. EB01 TaxID=1347086 RepID=UPI000693E0DB|nr:DUF1919 domain-containing protein [Bacillus sp. EB01]
MPSFEGFKIRVKKKYIEKTCKYRKKIVKGKDFTIISNNCWGGFIYQSYELPYNSPTIGLYFMADDFLKFVSNLRYYLNSKLEFINPNNSKYYEQLKTDKKFGTYPIGKLQDIEIIFLHYKSEEEALRKWVRRCNRVNLNKLLVKFNDQNGCTEQHLIEFDNLPLKNKICFTSKDYPLLNSVVYIKSAKNQKHIEASQEPFGLSRFIDINKLINSL